MLVGRRSAERRIPLLRQSTGDDCDSELMDDCGVRGYVVPQIQSSCEDSRFVFRHAMLIPGPLHILHNAMKLISMRLNHYPVFEHQLKAIVGRSHGHCRLLHRAKDLGDKFSVPLWHTSRGSGEGWAPRNLSDAMKEPFKCFAIVLATAGDGGFCHSPYIVALRRKVLGWWTLRAGEDVVHSVNIP